MSRNDKIFILGAARTAIGAFGGSFKKTPAHVLGSAAIKAAVQRACINNEQVDETIMGNVLMAGQGQGPGRQAALNAGIPETSPAWAINQLCGSGLKSVCLAANAVKAGEIECAAAGGMENMSMSPYLLNTGRYGARLGHTSVEDSVVLDGLTDVFSGDHMGLTAEHLADKFCLDREIQDHFALESQKKARAAMEKGIFSEEITPVEVKAGRGKSITVDTDEHPKPDTTIESLSKLRPAFKKEGTVTAGNASGINDGAAALVVAGEQFVARHSLNPMAEILSWQTVGINPYEMGLGPVSACEGALEKAGLTIDQIDLFELNEAFAAQSLSVLKSLKLDPVKVNINGGAIALGHPIGASGARILVTLLYELKRQNLKYGLASLCVGGGMGVAMVVKNI
jgi:acetyl-CoA C-acetyltransferase